MRELKLRESELGCVVVFHVLFYAAISYPFLIPFKSQQRWCEKKRKSETKLTLRGAFVWLKVSLGMFFAFFVCAIAAQRDEVDIGSEVYQFDFELNFQTFAKRKALSSIFILLFFAWLRVSFLSLIKLLLHENRIRENLWNFKEKLHVSMTLRWLQTQIHKGRRAASTQIIWIKKK